MSLLGEIAYRLYFRPLGVLKELSTRGVVNHLRSLRGGRELQELATRELQKAASGANAEAGPEQVTFVYLGGQQNSNLLFSGLASLYACWPTRPTAALISDGNLTKEFGAHLANYFPGLRVFVDEDLNASLERAFPISRFPNLRALRNRFLLARKFMDLRAVANGTVVFVDADTLFLGTPDWLVQWTARPETGFYLRDRRSAYSYPPAAMQALLTSPLLPNVNTGLFGINLADVDWDALERWYAALSKTYPDNHFVEQTLLAMLFSEIGSVVLPQEYICEPDAQQVRTRQGCFHHYVWPCRHLLFAGAWRQPVAAYMKRYRSA